ncbi:hypothetical protein [Methylopila sp. M107]|uniref:hypothetical protein n=1 Tax=Methylopila sp. M107 TaxID=1101190 RepID=UPI00036E9CAE|nr:hypothetical protein [Methylopila sp. M107]
MVDPMIARLAGCLVFASLMGGLLTVATQPYGDAPRDVVKVADLKKSVEQALLTRQ